MASFEGAYKLENGYPDTVVNHSVVAWGYTAKKVIWETTQEYIVNFGRNTDFYGATYINKSAVYANMSFNIL